MFDVNERRTVQQILEQDVEQHGGFYGVVLNAGLTHDGAFPALTDQDWDGDFDLSLDGFYNVLKPLIMPMIHFTQRLAVLSLYLLCLEL